MPERKTRAVGVVLAWLLAAAAATLIGVLAVGAIGSGIVASPQRPLSQEEVDRRLALPPPSASEPSGEADPATSRSTAPSTTRSFTSRGGSVVVRCSPLVLVQTVPAQGFELDDVNDRSDGGLRVRFESEDDTRVTMELSCQGDTPVNRTTVHSDDDGDDD